MIETIAPAGALHGVVSVPGDKSISHRYAMLTSIAEGDSKIHNYSTGEDCHSTLSCMRALGVEHQVSEMDGREVLVVMGKGIHGLRAPAGPLDVGNSGSTIRMLSGILAAQPFTTTIAGDCSVAKRPMRRIIAPLTQMGAQITANEGQFPPLTIRGSRLRGIEYELPVASAQVKSCVLLAGLYAEGETAVSEPVTTRDHTEIALRELGADVDLQPRHVRIRGGATLQGRELAVPGDLSSAAFFLIAALISRDADLILANVGLNPTRTALLDVLRGMGGNIKLLDFHQTNGELIGTLQVHSSKLKGGVIEGPTTAAVIDEIPILAILGAVSEEGLLVKDAAELRVKETDRIEAIASNLRRMGVVVNTTQNSIQIPGRQSFRASEIDSFGDHRVAMAFSVAALMADGPCTIQQAEAASVSFPEFYTTLRKIVV
ncbi:MAG: 3-phosphoshikimate 1-carboxyvinyltransferase [Acidobacteriaceae bacterium]|nr:3-phosphoshikimate 1-carboxyvinyltransferase [Acidobacteriaceae bacterium]